MSSGGLGPRVLQDAALEADVQQVAVHASRASLRHRHRDVVLLGVVDQLGRGEFRSHSRQGAMTLMSGFEGVGGELEADLVVALAGGAVGDGVGALRGGDLHLRLAIRGRAMEVPSR